MSFRHFIYISLLTLAFHGAVQACSICGCGDPLASAGTAAPLPGSFQLSLESQYLTATAQADDLASTESVRQVNLNTTVTYNPTNDLGFSVMLPLIEKYWDLTAPVGIDEGTPFGIGDLLVGGRYFFLNDLDAAAKQRDEASLSGGVYFPTGGIQAKSFVTGDALDAHAQLGTGAWAFYGGLRYSRAWLDLRLSVNLDFIGRAPADTADTTSPLYRYKFGNAFTGGIQGQWTLADGLALSLAAEGRTADADIAPDSTGSNGPVANTGGTVIDATPGVWWNVNGGSTLYAKVQLPILTCLNGVQQVDPTYIVGTQFLVP